MSYPAFEEALNAYQRGNLAQVRAACERVLKRYPRHLDALHLMGVALAQSGELEAAIDYFKRAMAVDPNHVAVQTQLAAALQMLGRYGDALERIDRAIKLRSDVAQAHDSRGNILADLGRYHEAIASYRQAIVLAPDYADAHNNLGVVLSKAKLHEEAIASFDQALRLEPNFAEAHANRALAFAESRRLEEAVQGFERALTLDPGMAHAWHGKGMALAGLNREDEALACYETALVLQPDFLEVKLLLAIAKTDRGQYAAAIQMMRELLSSKADLEYLRGFLIEALLVVCDWDMFDELVGQIASAIERGVKSSQPFAAQHLPISSSVLKKIAVEWTKSTTLASTNAWANPARKAHPKIRVGYFSPDFRDHPVTFLTAELFERHDRSQFEIFGFSFAPPKYATSARVAAAFDRFVDARSMSDRDCVAHARNLELDIAVDLAGHTLYSRPNLFALRSAPLQLHYIGFLGTMGAPFIDYMIADRVMIDPRDEEDYTEKIIYLPSYQVNDTKRAMSERKFTRAEYGLPDTGFVYCCFNSSRKLNPAIFATWMRILQRVPGSVLWLQEYNAQQVANLRVEATKRGVDAQRLVFAGRLPLPDYLARYALADLFLDTLPYNAGATGSDALWAGLPLLTCKGETFAGRYGASMLCALDLPELITDNLGDYEALAVQLGTQPHQLARVREKLAYGRAHGRLFDIARFTQSIETAYKTIYERHQMGLPPATFAV